MLSCLRFLIVSVAVAACLAGVPRLYAQYSQSNKAVVERESEIASHPTQDPLVAASPLSQYRGSAAVDEDQPRTVVVDLNPVIADFAEERGLTLADAKTEAMSYLGLLSLQRVAQSSAVSSEQIRPGVFQISAPASFHRMLPHAMESLRCGKKQICLELRIVTLDQSQFDALDDHLPRPWQITGNGKLPIFEPVATSGGASPFRLTSVAKSTDYVTATTRTVQESPTRMVILRADESKDLVSHFLSKSSDVGASVLFAPKITLFPGQTGSIADTTQRPFVVSVKPVEGPEATALQPVIQVVEEGTVVRVKASMQGDDVLIASDIAFSQIKDVDTFTFRSEETQTDVTVQLPRQRLREVHFSKRLKDQTTLLIDANFYTEKTTRRMFGRDTTEREYVLLMLSVNVLDDL